MTVLSHDNQGSQ